MKRVEIEKKKRLFDDFFKIDEAYVRYEKFNGRMTEPVRRLNFERSDAAALLVFNRDTRKLVLVEQFRYPAYEKGGGWLIEVMAGIVDNGENPEDTVRREALEEIGFQVDELTPIATVFLSPGGSSERAFLYFAEVENDNRVSGGGGLASEHEDIRILELSPREIADALTAGKIIDAKTLIALMWFRSIRDSD